MEKKEESVEGGEPVETQIVANYTISPPARRTNQQKLEIRKDEDEETKEDEDDTKISATFTISPPPSSKTTTFKLSDDVSPSVEETTITATINVPTNTTKKTETPPTSPSYQKTTVSSVQHRSLFDIDNATSIKLAEKLQQEVKKCDSELEQSLNPNETTGATNNVEATAVLEDKPDSPTPEKFGERRPSWRLKVDLGSKVMFKP